MKWAQLDEVHIWAPSRQPADQKMRKKYPEQFVQISNELFDLLVDAHSQLDKVARQVNSIKERQVRK